jgi:hypothetical protein
MKITLRVSKWVLLFSLLVSLQLRPVKAAADGAITLDDSFSGLISPPSQAFYRLRYEVP